MGIGNMQRALSAPGKLFLAGEYAVLWGGTARIAAIGPRSSALVRRREDREVHLLLEEGRLSGHATSLGVTWGRAVPEGFRFAARAVGEAFRAHGREALGLELALSPSFTAPDGRKLGMGGSARACVLAAEATRYVLEAEFDALKLALLAHGLEQNLKGSGGDVAAIFAGGIVRYRRYPVERMVRGEAPPVDLVRLAPPAWHLSYAFAGQSASTRVLIAEVERRLPPGGREAFVAESDTWGAALEEGLVTGSLAKVSEAAERLQGLLAGLGPLETEPMRRILALAKSYGCAGKMSGAGGGDGCVLFAPSAEVAAQMRQGLEARGFLALPLTVEPGLRGEAAPEPLLQGWL